MWLGVFMVGCLGFFTFTLGSQEGGAAGPNSVPGHDTSTGRKGLGRADWEEEGKDPAPEGPLARGKDQASVQRQRHRHHHHDDDGFGRHRHGRRMGLGRWGPFFEDPENATTVSVPLGGSVHLNCRVGMLHDKTVMWLRRSGDRVSLLTVGDTVYSSDSRVTLRYQYPNNWRLHISPVKRPDEGTYFCQLSTHPPRAIYTNITVLAPDLKVVDEHGHSVHDRYYKTGSTIELTCRVTNILVPSHVIWTKDDSLLPTKVTSTAISDVTAAESQSRLVVPRATTDDSGTYTCTISEFSFVEVQVHVLNGEKQAAVQHDSWGNKACIQLPRFWLNLLFILCEIICKIVS